MILWPVLCGSKFNLHDACVNYLSLQKETKVLDLLALPLFLICSEILIV